MNATGWSRGLEVTGGGTGVVSHAGLVLLRELADRTVRACPMLALRLEYGARQLARRAGARGHDFISRRARVGQAASDEDGYITYVGRTDDVFNASDYRICRSSWRAC